MVHLHYSIYPAGDYDAGIDPWPYLHPVESNVCGPAQLEVAPGGISALHLWDCDNTTGQRFALRGGIQTPGGLCLDIPTSDTTNGNQLQIYTCNGTGAQTWELWSP